MMRRERNSQTHLHLLLDSVASGSTIPFLLSLHRLQRASYQYRYGRISLFILVSFYSHFEAFMCLLGFEPQPLYSITRG